MDQLDKNGLTEAEYLARYDASMFPHPSVTADFALICGGALLLVKRGGHPCLGMWALPGGFSEPGEDLRQTAIRRLILKNAEKNIFLFESYKLGKRLLYTLSHKNEVSAVLLSQTPLEK